MVIKSLSGVWLVKKGAAGLTSLSLSGFTNILETRSLSGKQIHCLSPMGFTSGVLPETIRTRRLYSKNWINLI